MMAGRSQAAEVDEVVVIDDKDDSDIAVLIEETDANSETGQVRERNSAEVSDVRNMANKLEINKMLP